MKMFIFIGLLALISAVQEPEPINQEEKHDEVAQAQIRATWIACLMIAKQANHQHQSEIKQFAQSAKIQYADLKKKITADIIQPCIKEVGYSLAQELLINAAIDLHRPEVSKYVKINKEKYGNPQGDFKLSQSQVELFDMLNLEASRTDDGFDQEPPVVDGVEALVKNKNALIHPTLNYLLLVGALVMFGGIGYCAFKMIKPVPTKVRKKKRSD